MSGRYTVFAMTKTLAEDKPKYGSYLALALLLWLIVSVITAVWAALTGHVCTLILACLAVIAVLVWLGRLQASMWEAIKNWAQLLSFSGIILAAFGAYKTYFTPFSPEAAAGTIQFRIGANTYFPNSEMVIPFSFLNNGAVTGRLDNLAAVVSFPQSDCLFDPYFFVAMDQYTKLLTTVLAYPQGASVPQIVKEAPFEGPFGPILLPGKTQISKAVIFAQSSQGCKKESIVSGRYPLVVWGQFNHGKPKEIRKLWFELTPDKVDQWRAGQTVAVQMMQGDVGWLTIPFRK